MKSFLSPERSFDPSGHQFDAFRSAEISGVFPLFGIVPMFMHSQAGQSLRRRRMIRIIENAGWRIVGQSRLV